MHVRQASSCESISAILRKHWTTMKRDGGVRALLYVARDELIPLTSPALAPRLQLVEALARWAGCVAGDRAVIADTVDRHAAGAHAAHVMTSPDTRSSEAPVAVAAAKFMQNINARDAPASDGETGARPLSSKYQRLLASVRAEVAKFATPNALAALSAQRADKPMSLMGGMVWWKTQSSCSCWPRMRIVRPDMHGCDALSCAS